eukprot:TRINITY_DN48821_c0_g1_i1.p1 TRINITY_DN48821_c0_g1~~TRINITY_DN48821_c0_g1_i1.p1  ORF type:complete len:311 (-),score=94.72 TRINITY_DN48821_c0_g1_i1:199-1068(-)
MAAAVIALDIFPAVRHFLDENGLQKSVKHFDKEAEAVEDSGERKMKKRIVKRLASLELMEVCRSALEADAESIIPSDLYPVVRRFLEASEFQRTLKSFDKEATADEERKLKKNLAKRVATLDLLEAAKTWLEAPAVSAEAEPAAETAEPKAENKKSVEAEKKGKKRDADEALGGNENKNVQQQDAPKKKKNKAEKEEKPAGVPFKRVDEEKWNATIKDSRMMDNTHKAKQKFGGSVGDTWGDKAADDLLKVKGKGFRKEMAKKKRASWRGGGAIDQGVNSIKFDDSDDE